MLQQQSNKQKTLFNSSHTQGVKRPKSPPASYESDSSGSIYKSATDRIKGIGSDIYNEIVGLTSNKKTENTPQLNNEQLQTRQERRPVFKPFAGETHSVFSWREQEERREISKLRELIEMIRKEVEMLKNSNSAVMSEIKDIEKITLQSAPTDAGEYHISFMEIILQVLRALRGKYSDDSSSWMQALISKKKKRGSAFANLSKEKGTQYSLSQEMQGSGRSVQ